MSGIIPPGVLGLECSAWSARLDVGGSMVAARWWRLDGGGLMRLILSINFR